MIEGKKLLYLALTSALVVAGLTACKDQTSPLVVPTPNGPVTPTPTKDILPGRCGDGMQVILPLGSSRINSDVSPIFPDQVRMIRPLADNKSFIVAGAIEDLNRPMTYEVYENANGETVAEMCGNKAGVTPSGSGNAAVEVNGQIFVGVDNGNDNQNQGGLYVGRPSGQGPMVWSQYTSENSDLGNSVIYNLTPDLGRNMLIASTLSGISRFNLTTNQITAEPGPKVHDVGVFYGPTGDRWELRCYIEQGLALVQPGSDTPRSLETTAKNCRSVVTTQDGFMAGLDVGPASSDPGLVDIHIKGGDFEVSEINTPGNDRVRGLFADKQAVSADGSTSVLGAEYGGDGIIWRLATNSGHFDSLGIYGAGAFTAVGNRTTLAVGLNSSPDGLGQKGLEFMPR